jgi:CheY-like chemotaxis protein
MNYPKFHHHGHGELLDCGKELSTMARITILFADNDTDFLRTRKEFLEKEGYEIIPATSPSEAKKIFEQWKISLAILDLRLVNDDDEKDVSGLNLAKDEAYRTIPKIILTGFPSYEAVREALGPTIEGLPPAFDFLAKKEGPEVLVKAIKKALKIESWFQRAINGLFDQIKDDHEEARREAKINYWASFGVSIAGIVIIFFGIALSITGALAIGIPSAISGVIAEAVSFLFYRRADSANERMDKYHEEALQIRQFENLLAASEEFSSLDKRENCKERIIDAAIKRWLDIKG